MSPRSAAVRGAVLFSLLAASAAANALTPVFINEIHYDDVDADAGESIEVIAPSGTNLTGWSIVLYNGSSASAATTYSTTALSGVVADQCSGHGTKVVTYPQDGLQNGSNDAIALVNATGIVVQFLSYEGVATASNGPAAGMTSVDIGVSESGSTIEGTSLRLSGSGSDYEDFAWQPSAASTFGACNTGQTFGPPTDNPPSVATTTPADNATGVAVNANIAVNFSEAVALGASWYDILCSLSGTHTGVLGGSGASYTLDPAVDFASGETCTVTVNADNVVDVDPPADPMVADYSFDFTTLGDLAPTVSSTVPSNNAGSFPRGNNLQVNFSEVVTLDPGWYTLSCATSGTHTAVQSGTGANYTLNPDVDLALLEHCTLTVLADHVHDIDGTIHAMAANVVVAFDTAGDVGNYYAGVDTSSGPALKAWLHNRIKDHVAVPYSGAEPNVYTVINLGDQDPADTGKILDVYKNESYPKITSGAVNYNREHTWPNSLGFPNATVDGQPNPPYTDCHMLYASHIGYNSDRGNKPYANCPGCTERPTTLNHGFGGPGHSNWFSAAQNSFETWDHRKGDVARAVLYMAVRYEGGMNASGIMEPDLEVTDTRALIVGTNAQPTGAVAYMGLKTTLLEWSRDDQPDEGEHNRNEAVYSFQTNRNPFIDHPEWVYCVFTNTQCPVVVDAIFEDGFE